MPRRPPECPCCGTPLEDGEPECPAACDPNRCGRCGRCELCGCDCDEFDDEED